MSIAWARRSLYLLVTLAGCVVLLRYAQTSYDDGVGVYFTTFAILHLGLGLVVSLRIDRSKLPALSGTDFGSLMLPLVVVGLVECLFGMAIYGVTLEPGVDPDPSWFGVVAAMTLLLGIGAGLCGIIVSLMVLIPITLLVTDTGSALRGDRRSRERVLYSLLLLLVVAWATMMGFAVDSTTSTRRDFAGAILPLVGVIPDHIDVVRPLLLWGARLAVVALVVVVVLINRLVRRPAPDRAESDQPGA